MQDKDISQIQWFPGHMAKSLRSFRGQLPRADLVLEVADARIPFSSRNPDLSKITSHKARIVILTHADLADPEITKVWQHSYTELDIPSLAVALNSAGDVKKISDMLAKKHREILLKAQGQGRLVRPLRIVVIGIPNTGKSTLINLLVGKKAAKTANRPGVTRQLSWLKAGTTLELLDTPGLLPPKIETAEQRLALAATGAIEDRILPVEAVAQGLFARIWKLYPDFILQRYKLQRTEIRDLTAETLNDISGLYLICGQKAGCLMAGGMVDANRWAALFLKDFRSGRLGRISLETPDHN